ncbi:MAG: DUF695 domain-containing protein [Flavobacterium sp.]|nr:MAG: DUF695 domain-containing protein [Flavobacterium sp.]
MGFLEKIFNSKEQPINNYNDFWNWFQRNEKAFLEVLKGKGDIESGFFNKLSPKLNELRDGYFFLTGMMDDNTAELVLTADGALKNIVFVEELVEAAPVIEGWKFTALKPSLNIEDVTIRMANYTFSKDELSFYYTDDSNFPDEIDITVIHNDLNEANRDIVTNGTYIFLDNFLGELNFATTIDNINVGKDKVEKEIIPIEKLKDFLIWREKEFVEKYSGTRHNTENDRYSMLEAEIEGGKPLVAVINTDLLNWDSKASHPWILAIEVKFLGDDNGLPNDIYLGKLNELEDDLMNQLKDSDGYLNVGIETVNSLRIIYFACKDFRKPSKIADELIYKYEDRFVITFDIYKDKYWQSFNRFLGN